MAFQPTALGNINLQPNNPNQLIPGLQNQPTLHLQAFSPLNKTISVKLDQVDPQ